MDQVQVSIEDAKVSLRVVAIVFVTAFVPSVAAFVGLALEARANALAIAEQKALNREINARFDRELERSNEFMLKVSTDLVEIKTTLGIKSESKNRRTHATED